MHEIYLSYSKNTTLPLGIGSLHSDSHPFTHFHFDTFTSLLGLFNWHTDSHPFTHFYFDTFTSLTDHQLPFMPIPLQLHLGSEGILPLGSEAILSYTHLQLQHAPIRLDIYHSSSSSSHCLLLTCNQSHHNTYIIPWTCVTIWFWPKQYTFRHHMTMSHIVHPSPPTLLNTCLSNDISPIHWCIVVLTTIPSSSHIWSMHHTISRAHLYTSLRFQNSAIHFHTDSTPPTHITTHALPHIAYLWILHNVYRTMHHPPISNLIRLCTKVQLNYPSVRYGPTCSHVYNQVILYPYQRWQTILRVQAIPVNNSTMDPSQISPD